jgi:membrane protease YdiL (CAAX protease family)
VTTSSRTLILGGLVAGWALMVALVPSSVIYVPLASYAAVAAAIVWYVDGDELRSLFRPSAKSIVVGLAGAVASIVATYPAFALVASALPALGQRVEADYAATNISGNWTVLPALAVIVLAEEIIWRGAILRGASAPGGRWLIVVSLGTYVGAQIGFASWGVLLIAAGFGVVWTAQRLFTRSLLAPLLTHFLWNVATMVAWPVV